MANKPIKIILADWQGYTMFREKRIGQNVIQCGLGNIMQNISQYDAGIPFEMYMVINKQPYDGRVGIRSPKDVKSSDYTALKEYYDFVKDIFFKKNDAGRDIGAYDYGYNYLQKINYDGDVVFMNSSLTGPSNNNWLLKYRDLFYKQDKVGLCGISLNGAEGQGRTHIPMTRARIRHLRQTSRTLKWAPPHVQSFFLYTNMKVLSAVFGKKLAGTCPQGIKPAHWSFESELNISKKVLDAGFSIVSRAYENFYYRKGDKWTIPKGCQRHLKRFRKYANSI